MKILMTGAHQDDIEFMGGGLTSKYVKMGYEVRYLCMTNGNRGHHIMSPDETAAVRKKEAEKVAELLGVTYDIWDIDDCNLVADLPTRKKLIRYIREFNPDLIIAHRPNDYHADHRASAQLIQDASYLLAVPHECPEVKAMRTMPVIMYYEDSFKYPPFTPDVIVDVDSEIELKFQTVLINRSQVLEWLPYIVGENVPDDEIERVEWLKGINVTSDTTDEEIMSANRGYLVKFARAAARFRGELINKYGMEQGSKIRYAEAFELSEYGGRLTQELKEKLFSF